MGEGDRDRDVAVSVLRGSSCLDVAALHGLSVREVNDILIRYCRKGNRTAYRKALERTQKRRGRNRRYPSIDMLRHYAADFLDSRPSDS